MITIQNGIARRQNGTFKVIHSINLDQYRLITQQIESIINDNITDKHPLRPFLRQQIVGINRLLYRLTPNRVRKSLDFIGSAWKWIAGNPDSHDFQILDQKINNILENNNRQLIINELISNRVAEISNITNEIVKVRREGWNDDIANRMERKLIVIEKELENIEFAIQWAKANIVNSFILSKTEVDNINEILQNYNIPVYNIDELLSFGTVKIVTNSKEILYILTIPITQTDTCKTYLAKPVKYGNVIDKIEYNHLLECNHDLFAMKNQCKKYYDLTICNKETLIELRDNYCIENLFKNRVGNCTQINNEHVPTVEEIGPDLILLNQYQGTISVNEEKLILNGTYLIKYFNNTIGIDGREYYSKEISGNKPLPAFLQPKTFDDKIEEVISLELLKQLHVKNIKRLEVLENRNTVTMGTAGFVILILIAMTALLLYRKYQRHSNTDNNKPDEISTEIKMESPEAEPASTLKGSKTSSIFNIHSF